SSHQEGGGGVSAQVHPELGVVVDLLRCFRGGEIGGEPVGVQVEVLGQGDEGFFAQLCFGPVLAVGEEFVVVLPELSLQCGRVRGFGGAFGGGAEHVDITPLDS